MILKAASSKRELQAQIQSSSFERTILTDLKLAPPVRELHQDVADTFKETYLLDFLNLPEPYLALAADMRWRKMIRLRAFSQNSQRC